MQENRNNFNSIDRKSKRALVFFMGLTVLVQGCFVGESLCRGFGNARESLGCRDSEQKSEISDEEASGVGLPTSGGPGSSKTTVSGFVGQGFGLVRIVPEQLSQSVKNLGHFADHQITNDYTGGKLDLLNLIYGVPLGGIDFESSFHRDPLTKAQTVLVSRIVSYQFALQIFYKDQQRPAPERQIFTACDLNQDRPFGLAGDTQLPAGWQNAIKQGEIRWRAQVDDLFWRFLSRPPVETELVGVRDLFLTAIEEQKWTGHGWAALLYALLASEEFWHL